MLTRYHITLGATTTAGGVVTSASSLASLDGARIALENDTIACPACHAEGSIRADGPRLSERFGTRQVALSDDLCVCHCNPPPRLVNSQVRKYQLIDADWHAAQVDAAARTAAMRNTAGAAPAPSDRIPLLLRDPDTHEFFRNRPYRLQVGNRIIEGRTNHEGLTEALSVADRAALVAWHVGDGDSA